MKYTKEYFLVCAKEQEEIAEKFVDEGFGPGTINIERNEATQLAQKYKNAAFLMEKYGITETENIGCFNTLNVMRGQKVRIKKGAKIRTTDPRFKDGNKIAKKSYVVSVAIVTQGWLTNYPLNKITEEKIIGEHFYNSSVIFGGSGSYWCHIDFNDIELVEEA